MEFYFILSVGTLTYVIYHIFNENILQGKYAIFLHCSLQKIGYPKEPSQLRETILKLFVLKIVIFTTKHMPHYMYIA